MFPDPSVLAAAMPDLTVFQYSIVDNIFSMTVATMGAAAIFLFPLAIDSVDAKYRPALLISGLVVSIACYHYFMIRHSWQGAYELSAREWLHRHWCLRLTTFTATPTGS